MSHKNDNACTFLYNQGENHVDHRDIVLGVLGVSWHPQILEDQQPYLNQGDRICPPNYYRHPRIFRPSYGPEGTESTQCENVYLKVKSLKKKLAFVR